jgi:lipoprotein-releasing system permease protein
MRASVFLALRYLQPRWSFMSLITLLAILGPILGVAVLVVVISVMSGFGLELREKIFGVQAHLQYRQGIQASSNLQDAPAIADPEPALAALRAHGLRAVPVTEGPVLIQTRRQMIPKLVKGLAPPGSQTLLDVFPGMRIEGKALPADDEVLIGRDLAWQYDLRLGDKIIIHSTGQLKDMIHFTADDQVEIVQSDKVYTPEELTVVGIYSIGMYDFDANVLLTSLDKADDLFRQEWGSATSILVWVPDPFKLDQVLLDLRPEAALKGLQPLTWRQLNQKLFDALMVEKNMQFFLLIIIVVVAAFSIAGTLLTVVIQKTREIGVLKAMGAAPLTVLAVFTVQGAIVGALGVGLGTALGLAVVRWRNELAAGLSHYMGVAVFPPELYQFSSIPAVIDYGDITRIVCSAFIICVLAALLPACYAASLTPSQALRNDAG